MWNCGEKRNLKLVGVVELGVRMKNEREKMIMTFFSNSLHVSYREELTHGGLREKGEVQREKSSEWEVS
jgi:hypothetical protein